MAKYDGYKVSAISEEGMDWTEFDLYEDCVVWAIEQMKKVEEPNRITIRIVHLKKETQDEQAQADR